MSRAELADRGFTVRARVADERYPCRYGTIVDVVGPAMIGVRFDDGRYEYVRWEHLAPFGYRYAGRI